jgi:hypothetical protein
MDTIIRMFAPFAKVDEEKRMVFGYATTSSKDSQDEIVDLDASFEAVDEWKQWANIKEMHRPETAVGIAPIIEKHVGVGVYIGAEIVDDLAWKKCQKGVYKGFSIGGRVKERKGNHITKYELREISLVDRPANPDSVFMVAKRDDTNASVKEADGGGLMEAKEQTISNPVAGEATGIPPKAEAEAVVKAVEVPVVPPTPPAPAEETVTIAKAEFEKLKAHMQDMEKNLATRKEQDLVADAILKAVERLEPKIKKVHEEPETVEKSEADKTADLRKQMEKMSVGELTQMMLKQAGSKEE